MSLTDALSVENLRQAISALKTATPRVPFSTLVKPVPESLTPSQNNSRSTAMPPVVTTKFVQGRKFIFPNELSTEPATHDTCSHLRRAIPRAEVDAIIGYFIKKLRAFEVEHGAFDTFAFCGMSGALIAPILAHLMEKELLMIRKNGGDDGSNASRDGFYVEGFVRARRIIVVDDLIGTGATMVNIRRGITAKCPEAKFVALLLYENYGIPNLILPSATNYDCMYLWPDGV
jgi:adenine/guanine phosphoribosyltransferase-like PRPP-binding protein